MEVSWKQSEHIFAPEKSCCQDLHSLKFEVQANETRNTSAHIAGHRPVQRGEFIEIFCTGLGPVTNQPATGDAASTNPLSETTTTPTVTIGGIAATVTFSGLAPGFVGLYQVNVEVPAAPPPGDAVDVVLTIGGVMANTVTIAVE